MFEIHFHRQNDKWQAIIVVTLLFIFNLKTDIKQYISFHTMPTSNIK